MPYCRYCGTQMETDQRYCMDCGTPAGKREPNPGGQAGSAAHSATSGDKGWRAGQYGADHTARMDPEDIERNKAVAGLSYFIFFLPLVVCPYSPYARFHANQGLLVFICAVVASVAGGVLSTISSLFSHVMAPWLLNNLFGLFAWLFALVAWLCVLALGLLGLINGFSGKAVELPIIGRITLIK